MKTCVNHINFGELQNELFAGGQFGWQNAVGLQQQQQLQDRDLLYGLGRPPLLPRPREHGRQGCLRLLCRRAGKPLGGGAQSCPAASAAVEAVLRAAVPLAHGLEPDGERGHVSADEQVRSIPSYFKI